ncbi:MAG: glycosyltransferase [Eubacteriales bacterium]
MPAIVTIIAGLIAALLLFWRHPALRKISDTNEGTGQTETAALPPKISVIIPSRNEEYNLQNILSDLQNQDLPAYEIICVDDASEDRTAEVIGAFGVQYVAVISKPDGWVGKSWACQAGADRASGELLLFMDADVRLDASALRKLAGTYAANRGVISVQPFHQVIRIYEHLSFFFSLVLLAANGIGFPFGRRNIGLFGPVILVSREDYMRIEGHYPAKNSIVDDLAMGEAFKRKGIRLSLYMGGPDISFRMYSGGFAELCQGWIKNFASGAFRTPAYLILFIILWFGACTEVVISFIRTLTQESLPITAAGACLYLAWAVFLWLISRRVGSFGLGAAMLYPFLLVFFVILLLVSLFKKVFGRTVTWKGRKIQM